MTFKLIGAGIGACAGISGCEHGPHALQGDIAFDTILPYEGDGKDYDALATYFATLGNITFEAARTHTPFVIGGDHSCAIGTWSGISAYHQSKNQDIGLIWVDAHMDSHTPETSPSGNVHGMPLATLLGEGDSRLCSILGNSPKLKPENVILIGIRSFEDGEAALLKRLGVRIYFMEEVESRGIETVLKEAYANLSTRVLVGLTIDVDGFDPRFAPGVGTAVDHGIDFEGFLSTLKSLDLSKCCGVEITEYNPSLDIDDLTKKTVIDLVEGVRAQG